MLLTNTVCLISKSGHNRLQHTNNVFLWYLEEAPWYYYDEISAKCTVVQASPAKTAELYNTSQRNILITNLPNDCQSHRLWSSNPATCMSALESHQPTMFFSDLPFISQSFRLLNNWWNKVYWLWAHLFMGDLAPRSRTFSSFNYSGKWRHSKQDMLLFNTGCRVLWQHSLLHSWQLSDTSQRIHPHSTLCCLHATLTAKKKPVKQHLQLKLTHNDKIVEQSLAGFTLSVIYWHRWVPSSHDLALFHSVLKFTMANYMGLI